MSEAKPFVISKWEVWEAYKRVKANKGAAGVDEQTIVDFERKLKDNLYRICNRGYKLDCVNGHRRDQNRRTDGNRR